MANMVFLDCLQRMLDPSLHLQNEEGFGTIAAPIKCCISFFNLQIVPSRSAVSGFLSLCCITTAAAPRLLASVALLVVPAPARPLPPAATSPAREFAGRWRAAGGFPRASPCSSSVADRRRRKGTGQGGGAPPWTPLPLPWTSPPPCSSRRGPHLRLASAAVESSTTCSCRRPRRGGAQPRTSPAPCSRCRGPASALLPPPPCSRLREPRLRLAPRGGLDLLGSVNLAGLRSCSSPDRRQRPLPRGRRARCGLRTRGRQLLGPCATASASLMEVLLLCSTRSISLLSAALRFCRCRSQHYWRQS
jgi:hypothetical protein